MNKDELTLYPIAYIENDYIEKFGIPRQSGMVNLESRIVFTPEYRDENALRGITGYSHLWLLWGFDRNTKRQWSPMVKPPRLGGNTRMGVFATRSPYRPNPIGLTVVKLKEVKKQEGKGLTLIVTGADIANGTPIYDIKPYLPYADSVAEAEGGFATKHIDDKVSVVFEDALLQKLPERLRESACELLALDPRPAYHEDNTPYGVNLGGYDIRFTVKSGVLTVFEVVRSNTPNIK